MRAFFLILYETGKAVVARFLKVRGFTFPPNASFSLRMRAGQNCVAVSDNRRSDNQVSTVIDYFRF
jgi:hypothetical protein